MLDAPTPAQIATTLAAIGAADHAARRQRLTDVLAEHEVGALLVTGQADVRWLTGLHATSGRVLVLADAPMALITDDRYAGTAAALVADDLGLHIDRAWAEVLAGLLDGHGPAPLHVQEHDLTLGDSQLLTTSLGRPLGGVGELLLALRATKDDHEVACLRAANHITVAAMQHALGELRAGMTERQLAQLIERAFVDLGADGVAFESIVAFGDNSAVPHHRPTDRPLANGHLVKVDVGARVRGYHADCTRTVAFGNPSDELRAVHEIVVRAQALGRAAAVVGATTGDVDAACRDHIAEAGYGDAFVHGTGHGTGLQIHELPRVVREGAASIRAGSVLTVEPGIYLPGLGGVRIEDSLLVTSDGPDVLTPARRELVVL